MIAEGATLFFVAVGIVGVWNGFIAERHAGTYLIVGGAALAVATIIASVWLRH